MIRRLLSSVFDTARLIELRVAKNAFAAIPIAWHSRNNIRYRSVSEVKYLSTTFSFSPQLIDDDELGRGDWKMPLGSREEYSPKLHQQRLRKIDYLNQHWHKATKYYRHMKFAGE